MPYPCTGTTRSGRACRNTLANPGRCGRCGSAPAAPVSAPNATAHHDLAASRSASPDVGVLLEHPALHEVITRFGEADVDVFVVGGPVRDLLDVGHPGADIDLCSPADVATVKGLLDDLGAIPDTGQEFGTVRLCREGHPPVEVTQWRAESYRDDSRKPETTAATRLEDDLARRDFTVNAMAVDCRTGQLHDPYGGRDDLARGLLRTPADPDQAFSEDPLRVVRLVRFAATRGWQADEATREAARRQAHRLDVAAPERRLTELQKVLEHPRPRALRDAITTAQSLGVSDTLFGGLNVAGVSRDQLERVPPAARLAALTAATPPERRAEALRTLKFSGADQKGAAAAADLVDRCEAGLDQVQARRLVRSLDDTTLEVAGHVLASRGRPLPPALTRARADADRWRAPLPVNGRDGLERGLQGREVGAWLRRVEDAHLASEGGIDRDHALTLT